MLRRIADRRRLIAVPVLVAALVAGCASGAESTAVAPDPEPAGGQIDPTLPETMRNQVSGDAAFVHLEALQAIAERNGGNRESGTPGYDQSLDYVANQLREAGFTVETPAFTFDFFEAGAQSLAVGGAPVAGAQALGYSLPTPPEGITAPLVALPDAPADPTPACEASDFAGLPVAGAIAVARRGACPFTQKQALAADAGAVAMIVVNTDPGPLNGTLGSVAEARIPTAGLDQAAGDALFARAGTPATLMLETRSEQRETRNLIAQTTTGRTDEVILAGAHLDSVAEGSGMNDNGSGSAALLDSALALGGAPPVQNAVRFAWWGAEESGLLGAQDYVDNLPLEGRRDVAVLLNFDMIASPNAAYFAYDGDDSDGEGAPAGPPGSDAIERRLLAALDAEGVPEPEGTDFDGRSDYGPFIEVGIPAGGLFTGADGIMTPEQAAKWGGQPGLAYDPNYHTPADDLTNVNRVALDRNTRAMARTIGSFAVELGGPDAVPPRAQRAPQPPG